LPISPLQDDNHWPNHWLIIDVLRIGKIIDENTLENINANVGARWAMVPDITREFCTIADLNDDQHGKSPHCKTQ